MTRHSRPDPPIATAPFLHVLSVTAQLLPGSFSVSGVCSLPLSVKQPPNLDESSAAFPCCALGLEEAALASSFGAEELCGLCLHTLGLRAGVESASSSSTEPSTVPGAGMLLPSRARWSTSHFWLHSETSEQRGSILASHSSRAEVLRNASIPGPAHAPQSESLRVTRYCPQR